VDNRAITVLVPEFSESRTLIAPSEEMDL